MTHDFLSLFYEALLLSYFYSSKTVKYHHVTQAEKIKLLFLSGMDQRLQDSDSRQNPAQTQEEGKLVGPKSKPDARRQ